MQKWKLQDMELAVQKCMGGNCGTMDSQNYIYCNWRHFYIVLC